MELAVRLESTYKPSEDIVAREIEGDILIIPLVAGIGDMEDEIYNLNETGRAIWKLLDGEMALKEVVRTLSEEYNASSTEIEEDVIGFVQELYKRGILVETSKA